MTIKDVTKCMDYVDKPRFKCLRNVKGKNFIGRYNCKKDGACYWYKTQEEHEKETKIKKDEWERKTYERLKKNFEDCSF